MKKIIFLFSVFYFCVGLCQAQKVCYFKINMNDCDKCFLGLYNKKFIGKDIKVNYVFQKMYHDEKEEIVNKFDVDTLRDTIIFSDSLYRKFNQNNVSSTIHLYVNNQVFATFPMKAIDENFYLLNSPDTIAVQDLPKSFNYKLLKGKLYTFNRSKSEIVVNNLNDITRQTYKFKITDKITKMCFNAYFRDTFHYHNFYDSLTLRHIPKFVRLKEIISFDVNNDTVIVLSSFLYEEYCMKKGIQDTCMFNFYSLIKIYNKNISVTTVRQKGEGTLLSYDAKRLGILGFKLDFQNDNMFTNLVKKDFDFNESDRFLAKLSKTDDYLEDDKSIKVKMSKLNYKYPLFYVSDYVLHYPYVINAFSTELLNLETNKSLEFPINHGDLSYLKNITPEFGNPTVLKYKVIDFFVSSDTLKVIFIRNKSIYIQQFSVSTGKGIAEKLLLSFEDSSLLRTEPKFQDYITVILFPQSENYFVRVKSE